MEGEIVPDSTKKIVSEVIASLKKYPSPEKRGETFWDYLRSQLYSESTWDQKDLSVIEKEIDSRLSKLDKKVLTEMWEETDRGTEGFESEKKADVAEMKTDLTDEILGQVMDRMDDNYSSRGSYYTESSYIEPEVKEKEIKDDFDDDIEPAKIKDPELNIDDQDSFNEEEFDDEEDEPRF